MLAPFGWRVETVYFNSKYTYHIDCLMMQIDEGIYAIPETNPDLRPPFWTDLPKEIKDKWECVEIPFEEQQNGGCNTVTLGNGKFVIDESCERSMEILAKKGYTPIGTPWQTNWHTFHSGVHCSTLRLEAE
jgi:N-dimethylarginine dimethylaminohydrolase